MATAVATVTSVDVDSTGLSFTLYVALSGPEVNPTAVLPGQTAVGQGDLSYVMCRVLADDQPTQIRQKMGQAVRSYATSKGWSIPTGALSVPAFSKD